MSDAESHYETEGKAELTARAEGLLGASVHIKKTIGDVSQDEALAGTRRALGLVAQAVQMLALENAELRTRLDTLEATVAILD